MVTGAEGDVAIAVAVSTITNLAGCFVTPLLFSLFVDAGLNTKYVVEHQLQGESELRSKLSGEFINVYYEIDEYIRQYSSIDKIQET